MFCNTVVIQRVTYSLQKKI